MFVRDWALQQWEEGEQVQLQAQLPALKKQLREQRALEEHLLAAQAQQEESDGAIFEER